MHVRSFDVPPPEARELELAAFLKWLGGPAVFRLPGRDRSRTRLLTGGLHGNEPSGFYAVHQLLRDPPPDLPCEVLLALGNVRAALLPPGFSHRAVPGEEDMNRVWGGEEPSTPLRRAAAELLELLAARPIEAMVDLHNNTGFNPIYAVVVADTPERRALASAWTHRIVRYAGRPLGTLLEALDPRAPVAVVECGQAGDPAADRRALAGARRFLTAPDPFALEPPGGEPAQLFESVARITIPGEVSLDFAAAPTGADLTIFPGIDRYNFQSVAVGTLLAFCSPRGRLVVTDNAGRDVSDEFLVRRDGRIYLMKKIVPVMMTTDAGVAKSDCLLYAAERR